MSSKNRKAGLILASITIALNAVFFLGFRWLFQMVPDTGLSDVYTNIATIGSVAAGLSLVGFGMIISNSTAMTKARSEYGRSVGAFFVLSHASILLASLAIGILSGFTAGELSRCLGALFTTLISFGFSVVILFLNALYGWEIAED